MAGIRRKAGGMIHPAPHDPAALSAKISEKSLELNVGAELLATLRGVWGMPKAYLRGLTQREEKDWGVDFFVELAPTTRIFAFQFKAPKGQVDDPPYRYRLSNDQHGVLHTLALTSPDSVYYVLPFYVTHEKLARDVPFLVQDTWLLPVAPMLPANVFGGKATKIIRCEGGVAHVNPKYPLQSLRHNEGNPSAGVPAREFAAWYRRLRSAAVAENRTRRSPWLVRGLLVAIVGTAASAV